VLKLALRKPSTDANARAVTAGERRQEVGGAVDRVRPAASPGVEVRHPLGRVRQAEGRVGGGVLRQHGPVRAGHDEAIIELHQRQLVLD